LSGDDTLSLLAADAAKATDSRGKVNILVASVRSPIG